MTRFKKPKKTLSPEAQAAQKAIRYAGGPMVVAERLTEKLGKKIKVDRVNKWRYRGVQDKFVLLVSELSGVPRHELAPGLYPDE